MMSNRPAVGFVRRLCVVSLCGWLKRAPLAVLCIIITHACTGQRSLHPLVILPALRESAPSVHRAVAHTRDERLVRCIEFSLPCVKHVDCLRSNLQLELSTTGNDINNSTNTSHTSRTYNTAQHKFATKQKRRTTTTSTSHRQTHTLTSDMASLLIASTRLCWLSTLLYHFSQSIRLCNDWSYITYIPHPL